VWAIATLVACAAAPAAQAEPVGNGRVALDAFAPGRADIVSVKPNGSGWTNLTPGDHQSYCSPEWSPDGTRIAFVAPDPPQTGGVDLGGQLFVMNADGSGVRQIMLARPAGECFRVTWSGDGAWIAYKTTGTDIDAIRSNGLGAPLTVTDGAVGYRNPAWSHDGSRIVYNGEDGHLYATPVRAVATALVFGSRQQVDQNDVVVGGPDWSPDDARLVGELDRGLTTLRSTDGGGAAPVTAGSTGTDPSWFDSEAAWSPNGRKIAFARHFFDAEGGGAGHAIYTVDADGGTPSELTRPVGDYTFVGDPDWQPLPRG
jgi:Tol biopolymer transport system component